MAPLNLPSERQLRDCIRNGVIETFNGLLSYVILQLGASTKLTLMCAMTQTPLILWRV